MVEFLNNTDRGSEKYGRGEETPGEGVSAEGLGAIIKSIRISATVGNAGGKSTLISSAISAWLSEHKDK